MKKSKDEKKPRANAAEVLFWSFIGTVIFTVAYAVALVLLWVYKPAIFARIELELEIIGFIPVSAITVIYPLAIIIAEIVERLRKRKKKQSDIKKIFKTTDGYFTDRIDITKPRNVAVIYQRKDDGAVAVVKVYSQKDKKGRSYISDLVLTPEEHKALTEDSIIGNQVIIGIKQSNGKFKPLFTRNMLSTNDELTEEELNQVKKKIQHDTPQHRKTHKRKIKRWKKHFRK